MKFSIIYEAQMVDTSRKNEARVFNEIIEQSLLAEQVGFDNVWAVEHTALTQYAHCRRPRRSSLSSPARPPASGSVMAWCACRRQ